MKPMAIVSANWKILLLWAILFAGLLGYGIAQHFENIWLFAIAMALASWGVCGWGLHVVWKWREWRGSVREDRAGE
jgi:hypothetical protein